MNRGLWLDLIRGRSRVRTASGLRTHQALLLLMALGLLALAGFVLLAGVLTLGPAGGLPGVGDLGAPAIGGRAFPEPSVALARDGEVRLFSLVHPKAEGRQWLVLDAGSARAVPSKTVQAFIASHDPAFWSHRGFRLGTLLVAARRALGGAELGALPRSITQRVAGSRVLSVEQRSLPPLTRLFLEARWAERLSRVYAKDEILAQYLNSAHFGNLAYGLDAAARVYFGVPARDLTLGESALLAGLALDPGADLSSPAGRLALQWRVLDAMLAQGLVTQAEYREARVPSDRFATDGPLDPGRFPGALVQRLERRVGSWALEGQGLRVLTTIDGELGPQVACTLADIRDDDGRAAGGVEEGRGEEACSGVALLLDAGWEDPTEAFSPSEVAAVVLDPRSGEILAAAGRFDALEPLDSAFTPFLYLAGFARGYSPGSLVLDIPLEGEGEASAEPQGAVRAREAMAKALPYARAWLKVQIGAPAVRGTAGPLGIRFGSPAQAGREDGASGLAPRASLLDLTYAHAALANRGVLVGLPSSRATAPDRRPLDPFLIRRVESQGGEELYSASTLSQPVLSAELAYLVVDVLGDASARWPMYGGEDPLELGVPSAAFASISSEGAAAWALGGVPRRAVGVKARAGSDGRITQANGREGPIALWREITLRGTKDLPPEGWAVPAGIVEVEVCLPSGMLPTEDCPRVVREIFLRGTEPTSTDTFYKRVRVNRETGRLATVNTPPVMVESKVYFHPPEAVTAVLGEVDSPPVEYDPLWEEAQGLSAVRVLDPQQLDFVRGHLPVRVRFGEEGFSSYRLAYGEGLAPSAWVTVSEGPIEEGGESFLGTWDTGGLEGAYTLQVMGIGPQGRLWVDSVIVSVDNEPPVLSLLEPLSVADHVEGGKGIVLVVEAADNLELEEVALFIDGVRVATSRTAPLTFRWEPAGEGAHTLFARALDKAGNVAISERMRLTLGP